MPTTPGAASVTTLDPKAAVQKFSDLITETGDTETPEPEAPKEEAPPASSEPPPQSSETEPPEPDAETYEVKVDGEVQVVDLDELKAGYSREGDYRKKTMALAEERRAFESEHQTIQQERKQYQDGLAQIRQALEQLQGEPNWDELRKSLPAADFIERRADWEHQRVNIERLKSAEKELADKQEQDRKREWEKYARSEQDKLLAAIPEWRNQDVYNTELAKLVETGKLYGFSEQEVLSATDHRAYRLLRDAWKYRELHREPTPATKAKVSAIKSAKPGTPERPRPNAKQEKLIEQTKSGRQRDAMAAILEMLPD